MPKGLRCKEIVSYFSRICESNNKFVFMSTIEISNKNNPVEGRRVARRSREKCIYDVQMFHTTNTK